MGDHSQLDSVFRIEITLDEDFKKQFQKLKRKYGEEMFAIEGLDKDSLNITRFFDKFMNSDNVANASIDDNSNVTDKNVTIMLSESRKPYNKLLSHNKIYIELKEKFDKKTADKWLEWQINGALYSHDSHESTLKPYCFAFSLKPIVDNGLYFLKDMKANPANHLDTFNHHVLEFISYATNLQSGAVGVPDYLIYAYYFWRKDIETGYIHNPERYKKQKWQEIIFNLNQPYLKGGEQCVTEDTEVLTPKGFKKYHELGIGDDIYTWQNGNLNIQKVKELNIYDFDGEMHCYKGKNYLQQVTPEHKVLYKDNFCYSLAPSKKLIDKTNSISMPVAIRKNDKGGIDLFDHTIQMIATVLAMKNLNLEINDSLEKYFGRAFVSNLTRKNSTIPNSLVRMSKRQAKLFLSTWGEIGKNTKKELICQESSTADKLQHIAFLAGYGSEKIKLNGENISEYIIRLYEEENVEITERATVSYKGKVWCPTTDDGIVVFRHNGRIFISGNSSYTNFSILDREHIIGLFGAETFPDGSLIIDHLEELIQYQKDFLDYERKLRHEKFFTFPVISASLLFQNGKYVDEDMSKFISNHNMEWGDVNVYNAKNVDALSSCCRLLSSLKDIEGSIDSQGEAEKLEGHFNSIGGSSISIGSLKVNTINLVRIALESRGDFKKYKKILRDRVEMSHKYLYVQRIIIEKNIKKGLLPIYAYGLMDMKRQFSTIGITGVFETIQLLGGISQDASGAYYNERGLELAREILSIISLMNEETNKLYKYNANMEQIPSESCAIKICKKDKLIYGEDAINTYIYGNQWIPLNQQCDMMERIRVSSILDEKCGGGVMLHINLNEKFKDEEQAWAMMNKLAREGIIYSSFILKINVCSQDHSFHGNICPTCGGKVVDSYIKIVGYLVKASSYKKERAREMGERVFYNV